MGHHEHHERAPRVVMCAVVTVSDSRSHGTDESGPLMQEILEEAGHQVAHFELIPDDEERIGETISRLASRADVEAVLVNGGTGIAPRDRTFEAISALLERKLEGFGEIFRSLSYQEIGPAAILSRAVAGLVGSTVVFSMPGSPGAVRLAMKKLVVPELGHVVGEARRGRSWPGGHTR
jgi:molybdenum cofactor biosynthesis protein B